MPTRENLKSQYGNCITCINFDCDNTLHPLVIHKVKLANLNWIIILPHVRIMP